MAFVDPSAAGGVAVTRCFNSQASGATISTPPCGISIVSHSQGSNTLDFGFEVDDRFVTVTPSSINGTLPGVFVISANQLEINTYNIFFQDYTDDRFYIVVY